MKRFLCKCLLLALIITFVLVVAGQAYKHTNAYLNLERTEETDKYQDLPETVEFAVFGNSHGRDAFPFCLEYENAFNFSMSSQTPQYDWMLMREFQTRFSSKAIIVINIDYISFYFNELEEEFESKQERYYRILSPQNIVDVDFPHWLLQRVSPVLTTSVQSVAAAFVKPEELINTDGVDHQLSPDEIETEQERILRDHVGVAERSFPNVNPTMWDAYCSMLKLCRENDWHAVLVTPPVPEDYNACFPEGFYEEFCRRAEMLSAQFDVPWLDYSHDPEFEQEYSYFKNIDHLNLAGARVFNEKFWGDLENIGLK